MKSPALFIASLLVSSLTFAQVPPRAPAPPPAPRPAAPAPPANRPPPPTARGGMAITVTSAQGTALPGVHVEVLGTSDRNGDTNSNGELNLTAMQPDTYRVRFSGEGVVTFEKEVVLRSGQIASLDITLNAAAPPPEPPPPPAPEPVAAPPPPPVGPAGQPRTLSLVDMIERELISGNQPRRDSVVACSGNSRTTLVQLNQEQPERLYDSAEVTYYVVAGEGTVRMGGRDAEIEAGSFVSVPRGTAHGLARRGRRPLILIATVSGTPCEEAR